jgi:hypothetical protein
MEHELKRYKVLLYQRGTPDEFNWSEAELYGFLGNRFGSEAAVADAIAEVDEKGTATRTIVYALGNTARIVISGGSPGIEPSYGGSAWQNHKLDSFSTHQKTQEANGRESWTTRP